MEHIQQKVLTIIRSVAPAARRIGDVELLVASFLDDGTVDSLQIVEMITTLEEHFHIKFSSAHLGSEAFRTPAGISDLIRKQLKNA